jgi:hypothetical protein
MQVGVSEEERLALIAFLREHLDSDRSPRSSRLRPLRTFLSKLVPVRPPEMSAEPPSLRENSLPDLH